MDLVASACEADEILTSLLPKCREEVVTAHRAERNFKESEITREIGQQPDSCVSEGSFFTDAKFLY